MDNDFDRHAPPEWTAHWRAMPNSARALYGIFALKGSFGLITKEVRIEAWGQLCFDDAANNAIAYHIVNHPAQVAGWTYVSWRCEMDSPPMGGAKLAGTAPINFDVYNYVPNR